MTDAKLQAQRVCCWVKANPKAFKTFMTIGHRFVDEGRHLTRSKAFSTAEDMGIAINDGDGNPTEWDITRNHNFWSCLTRLMVMFRPRLAKSIEFRSSKFDEVDLAEIWHENVNAGTVFLAANRKEAQRAVELGDVTAR